MGIFRNRRNASAIQQAVRVASRSPGPDRSTRHFLVLVIAIIIAGSTMVGFARAERQYEYPTTFDSWENAYAVFDCRTESWLEPFETLDNPNGIRTRGDGVIYIEPTVESAAGKNAQLGLFLENVGVSLDDTTLTLPDGTTLAEEATTCRGEQVQLQVLRWDVPVADTPPTEIRTEGLAATRFLGDDQAFVIALAPLDSAIPLPSSVANLTVTSESSPS